MPNVPDTLSFLVLALATWRAAYFVTKEKGPFGIMSAIRNRVTFGGLLTCLYCASVWCALILYALWYTQFQSLVWIAGASGAAMFVYRYTGGEHGG